MPQDGFDLTDFVPYLLNQAAEQSSLGFQRYYKGRYGMLRTEWRVLFHLGRYGDLTARDICRMSGLHKTKVSRAVAALQGKRFLQRKTDHDDRRFETLSLTGPGRAAFDDLSGHAKDFETQLLAGFDADDVAVLRRSLRLIAGMPKDPE